LKHAYVTDVRVHLLIIEEPGCPLLIVFRTLGDLMDFEWDVSRHEQMIWFTIHDTVLSAADLAEIPGFSLLEGHSDSIENLPPPTIKFGVFIPACYDVTNASSFNNGKLQGVLVPVIVKHSTHKIVVV
jgi:hypothetical protein